MGLAEIQHALARLLTEGVLREAFFAAPEAVGESLGLTPLEARQMAALSPRQTRLFSASLQRKRLNDGQKLLPLTRRALEKAFARLFLEYATTNGLQEPMKHRNDAMGFVSFLQDVVPERGIDRWVIELARYEAVWLEAADRGYLWVVRWFHYPVGKLALSLAQRNGVKRAFVRLTVAVWFRFSRRHELFHVTISLPW